MFPGGIQSNCREQEYPSCRCQRYFSFCFSNISRIRRVERKEASTNSSNSSRKRKYLRKTQVSCSWVWKLKLCLSSGCASDRKWDRPTSFDILNSSATLNLTQRGTSYNLSGPTLTAALTVSKTCQVQEEARTVGQTGATSSADDSIFLY